MGKFWKKIDKTLCEIVDMWIVLAGAVPLVIVNSTSLIENNICVIVSNIIAYSSMVIFAYVFIKGYLQPGESKEK